MSLYQSSEHAGRARETAFVRCRVLFVRIYDASIDPGGYAIPVATQRPPGCKTYVYQ